MSMAVAQFRPQHGTCHESAVRTDMPPSAKRLGDDTPDILQPTVKIARTDSSATVPTLGIEDGANRKKMAGSSRTGQACDRCKVRKIRCDARPGGCSPCMQNQTECKTTDRITGRATSRGHTENLETENTTLRLYIIELQAQLKEQGIEPRPAPPITPTQPTSTSQTPPSSSNPSWEGHLLSDGKTAPAKHSEATFIQASLLPDFRPGCIGDNYLGVVSENSWLSPIEGTSLSLFGTKIDLADFMPQESTPDLAAMSYETFLDYAFGRRPVPQAPQLPEYESCKVFADWYFRSITPFVPILHKPEFMQLLDRIFLEHHETNSAETVMVHMMLAQMNFQWSARNKSEPSRKQSFEHYHYSLTFIPQLIASHQLADLQALALICCQLRSQPRSGAAWWFTNLVMGLAVESGLHRSVTAWQRSEFTPHVVEMRKRVFWSIFVLHVSMSGKLGRPMPLRFEDFDVEIPEALPDNLPGEVLPKWKRCSFRTGVQEMKMIKILSGVYTSIYSVRSTNGPYEVHVRQVEKDLEAFKAQLPLELQGGSQTREEERVYVLYLQFTAAEIQLLLHHPSLCRSQSPRTIKASLDTCLQATASLLDIAKQLKLIKGLDTTWYTCMTFLAAIFTTLFIHHERRDDISMGDVQTLKEDMAAWLDVMGEVGQLLGSTQRLQNAVAAIIEDSLTLITTHVATKTASAATVSTEPSPPSDVVSMRQAFHDQSSQTPDFPDRQLGEMSAPEPLNTTPAVRPAPSMPSQQVPSTVVGIFGFNESQNTALSTYPSLHTYDTSHYSTEDSKPTLDSHMNAVPHQRSLPPGGSQANLQGSAGFSSTFQPPVTPQAGFNDVPGGHLMDMNSLQPAGVPIAWRHFANNVMTNMTGHDYMTSANGFMALNIGPRSADMAGMEVTMPIQMASNPTNPNTHQGWPYIQYDMGPIGQ